MKKLLTIVVLSLFLTNNVFATVYFCSEIDSRGFAGAKDNREPRNYILSKFKAKITFEPKRFSSNDLGITWNNMSCLGSPSQKYSMTWSNYMGDVITIDGSQNNENFFKFNKAMTFGRGDDLILSHGTCEKF